MTRDRWCSLNYQSTSFFFDRWTSRGGVFTVWKTGFRGRSSYGVCPLLPGLFLADSPSP